jgi:hypothetical protein
MPLRARYLKEYQL